MKRLGALVCFVLGLTISVSSYSEAGIWFPPFWQLDARVQLVPAQVNVTVPTGYWGGPFIYPWLGSPYGPFYGPLYVYPSVFGIYPWLGGRFFYGFLDALTYTYTGLVPRVVYWNSFYWDPDAMGYALDIVTMADESTGTFQPLDDEVIQSLTPHSHTWDVNGGHDTGSFSPYTLVQIGTNGDNLKSFVESLPGMTPDALDAFVNSQLFQDVSVHPDSFVGLEYASYKFAVPEPSTSLLFAVAGVLMLGYGWRCRRRIA
jgi:hypothetical protein